LAAGIFIAVKAWNADADAAKKAAKAAQEAQKVYEEASAAHDEIMSSVENYKTASESLETLTRGTIEWTEAVNKCNQEVISLLEKFPELS
jgi:Flp pilus assembly protein TadG